MLSIFWVAGASGLLVGGEWAGWCCSFNSKGQLKPVPEQYLSDTAIEWGQIPKGFEELTTETIGEEGSSQILVRRTVRVLPEDGCLAENVGAEIRHATLPFNSPAVPPAIAIDMPHSDKLWRIETVFDGIGTATPFVGKGALPASDLRTRLVFTFDPEAGSISSAGVSAWQERCWDSGAGALTVHEDGGRSGLDSAWVSSAVGLDCFAEQGADGRFEAAENVGGTLFLPTVGVTVLVEHEALAVALETRNGPVVVQRIFDGDQCSSRLIGSAGRSSSVLKVDVL